MGHSPRTTTAKKSRTPGRKPPQGAGQDRRRTRQAVNAVWQQNALADPSTARPADLVQLQRMAGNRAVGRLIQAKLTVGPVGDRYEQEADRAAEQVMSGKPHAVQRQGEEEVQARRASAAGSFEAGGAFESRLSGARGGSPLPDAVRRQMERGLGADFSGVRVHTGGEASRLNRSISAQAFTHGQDIYLGEGRYDPGTSAGNRLLAHELTHVVQQGGASAQRKPDGTIQRAGDKLEKLKEAVKKVPGAIASGAETVGGGIASGAKTVGHGIASGATTIGHGIASGATTIGHGIASGATTVGHGIASGATTVGHGIASGARTVGHGVATAAVTAGHGIASGARAVGHGVATAAVAAGHGIATGARAVGHGIATAAETVGGGIAAAARWVGGKITGVHLGLRDIVEPIKKPASLDNMAAAHTYAGDLLYAIDGHKFETDRNLSFLEQDEIQLEQYFAETVKAIEEKKQALQAVKEPTGRMARLQKSAGEQRAKLQSQLNKLTAYIAELNTESSKAEARTAQAKQSQNKLNTFQLDASVIYQGVLESFKKSEPLAEAHKSGVQQMAQKEEQGAGERNAVSKNVNTVRQSGRSERFFTYGIAKLIGGKVANVALQTATLTMLGVESKDRPGGYSSTLKVSNIFTKTKNEFERLKRIAGSKLYGNRAVSTVYATIKGASTLVVAPLRNLAGALGLISTGLGAGLGVVTLGAAAAPFVAASAILTYIALGLTGLNALINGALAIWNGIRLKVFLKNQAKRGQLAAETSETAATAITELGSAGAQGMGVGLNFGLTQATVGHQAAQDVLRGVVVEGKPLWVPIVKTLAEKGVDIPSQALPAKLAGKVSPGGLGYKEAHETGLLKPGYRPHPSHGPTIAGHKVGVPHPKFLAETVPAGAGTAAHAVRTGAEWVGGKVTSGVTSAAQAVSTGVGTAKDVTLEKASEFSAWTAKELQAARTAAEKNLSELASGFSTGAAKLGTALSKILDLGKSASAKFAEIKAKFSKSKPGAQDQNAVEMADMGTSLGPSMADWLGGMGEVVGEASRWATLQAQEEKKTV